MIPSLSWSDLPYNIILSNNLQYNVLHGNSSINYYTSHCKWVGRSVFKGYDPGRVNRQIIQVDNPTRQNLQLSAHSAVCTCFIGGKYNCRTDFLGSICPGQTPHVHLCLPYTPTESIMSSYMDSSIEDIACMVKQTEVTHVLTNVCTLVNFTIASNNHKYCKLFLTTQPNLYKSYDIYFVQLLPCPVGFTLQNGVCGCDDILRLSELHITDCKIDNSVIVRPANSWIYHNRFNAQINIPSYYISS